LRDAGAIVPYSCRICAERAIFGLPEIQLGVPSYLDNGPGQAQFIGR